MKSKSPHRNKLKAPQVDLHPISQKMLRKGHFWITADSFSRQFPYENIFLMGKGQKDEVEFLLLNDPDDSQIKARLWSRRQPLYEELHHFPRVLRERIYDSFQLREKLNISSKRNCYYLAFAEADLLPGLKILRLDQGLLIQSYTSFWKRHRTTLRQAVLWALNEASIDPKWIAFQSRHKQQELFLDCWKAKIPKDHFIVEEFGIKYNLRIGKSYDFGLYPDMASIRETLQPLFSSSKEVLNLYSYTGSFSLYALSCGAEYVTSVDLSKEYLSQLDKNLTLNKFDKNKHQSLELPVLKALDELKAKNNSYDLIISDPPTSSNDGQKRSKALKDYELLLPKSWKILNSGGHIVIFLNTHSVTKNKFQDNIKNILTRLPDAKIVKALSLSEDCPVQKGFPEGDYLKGIIVQKK